MDEVDIEEHDYHRPGGPTIYQRIFRSLPPPRDDTPGRPEHPRRPAGPGDGDAILRFTEMLMNDFGAGPRRRSGPATLSPPDSDDALLGRPPRHFHRATFTTGPRFSGGTASFTIATSPMPLRGVAGHGAGLPDFESVFGNIMDNVSLPDPNVGNREDDLPPVFPTTLHQILSTLLNPAGAVYRDAAYSRGAPDRIITALIGANPQSNAAPPASQSAIDRLQRKKVDDKMLGSEGKVECTICISAVDKGEEVVTLPCNHWFHDKCVVMWLKEHNTCPVCRNPIERGNSNASSAQQQPTQSQSQSASTGRSPSASQSAFNSPYRRRERSFRSPTENEDRLNAIRNLVGPRHPRRNSLSLNARPDAASEHGSRSRQRSPSPGSRRSAPSDRDSDHNTSRRGSAAGNSGGHGIFGFLRDRFSRGRGRFLRRWVRKREA